MRVLLLGEKLDPQVGGGHTITQTIFNELLLCPNPGSHHFFLRHTPAMSNTGWPKHFSTLNVRLQRTVLRRIVDRIRYETRRGLAFSASRRKKVQSPYFIELEKAFRDELVRNKVDCALSLEPDHLSPYLPHIATVWDLEHRRKPYFPEVSVNQEWERREKVYRRSLSKAIAVITGTETGKKQIEKFYGVDGETIEVIPFPTPDFALKQNPSTDAAAHALTAGITGEFLFYPAQFWAHKNHVRLLEVLKILREKHSWNGSLVFCGSDQGNLTFVKQRAKALGVQQNVHFLGFIERERMVALYRRALALPFVSYFAPDNLPPLEAFALGCPVIASAVDGAKEFLGDAALYANPDNASDIVSSILRVKQESGLKERLIANGLVRASCWTGRDYADRLIKLLDSLERKFECFRTCDF